VREALEEIRAAGGGRPVKCLALDLGDLASVRSAAREFLSVGHPLHLLVNNAGVAGAHGRTASGFELAFGVNHLGHFLLTQLLLDRLRASAPARIVTVASKAHYRAQGIDWEALRERTRSGSGLPEYSVSKLCNVLFSAELGRRLAGSGVTAYSLHPGVVATGIWRSLPWPLGPLIKLAMISPEKGAATTLHCASAPELERESGLYYDKCEAKAPSALAQDPELAATLWRKSEEWVG
jgi:NAD(P)-dependent dehydrogenase (short-subunit alcohol dehydrogenase family)